MFFIFQNINGHYLAFINILFLKSKCIVYEAEMIYLRMPSLPLMKDVRDVREQRLQPQISNLL